MSRPGLTDEQISHFKTFGYIVLKELFTEDELVQIQSEFDFMMQDQYGHDSYDGSRRHWTMMMDQDTPTFASLLEDARFLKVARQLYGDDVIGVGIDANRYTGDTGWHRDTSTVHQYGVKFAFYLQPVEATTGALRVIPGMHRLPNDESFAEGVRSMTATEVPSTCLPAEPGDVVAFDLRLWHASHGGSTDRHMCTVVYYANPKTDEELTALQQQSAANVRIGIENFKPKRRHLYSKDWVANPGGNADRQGWIDRLQEIGYFDAPGVVEA
ncbi:MAG: hypothetical protein HOM68_18460 [Gemmatimonadetes bacterium]|jgi:ectoine hydroxylase-related dioxygenase (phytanoyl-CoA dioxygenase family)|nr:hypothetical protein [Gemmatimonadota bacterium]MBT5144850.1 hypothetical protein [Gemmatimonadota bacterium]MBT5586499.1 hypothetical protein [Gemmatimonadota bacterium]MBT5960484.1 hypothetical protein [Gemmatimonadota bacterium]MBT6630312.1 hypothetical protein [Gemmatimonadota bacterium]